MEHEKHLTHYVFLFMGLVLSVSLLIFFRFNRSAQLISGFFGAAFYVSWGIIHHALEDRLSKEIIIEYLLFGVLAFVMLFFALNI